MIIIVYMITCEQEMAERAAAVKNLIVQAQKQDASGDEQVKKKGAIRGGSADA